MLRFLQYLFIFFFVLNFVQCSESGLLGEVFAGDAVGIFPPLDEKTHITGTFGEFRNSHYHYGLDLGCKIGTPIFAARGGYVKKFMYQRYGIGYGLILQHKNNITSLYGHLDGLTPDLLDHPVFASYRKKIQQREQFRLTLPEELIYIKKGQLLGWSGDTGSGPRHLHFELRDDKEYLNPLNYGLTMQDEYNIKVEFISLMPADQNSRINGLNKELKIPVSKRRYKTKEINKVYLLKSRPKIQGRIKVRLAAYDPEKRAKLGLASGEMKFANKTYFRFDFDRMKRLPSFSHFRFYDHAYSRLKYGTRYLHNLHRNNTDPMPFANALEGGIIHSKGMGPTQRLEVKVLDKSGKRSVLVLNLTRDDRVYKQKKSTKKPNVLIRELTELESDDHNFQVEVQEGSLLNSTNMKVQISKARTTLPVGIKKASPLYKIITNEKIFISPILISFKVPKKRRGRLYKLIGKQIYPIHYASYKGGIFTFKEHRPGSYQVLEDTVPPVVKPPRKRIFRRDEESRYPFRLYFKINDIGSGVDYENIKVWVDNKKALIEHNGDLNAVEIFSPIRIYNKGRHRVKVKAVDHDGNHAKMKIFSYRVK